MPEFPHSFFNRLGVFKQQDNIKLPGTGTPISNTSVVTAAGVANTSTINGGFSYNTFTSSGTISVGATISADILLVAGGGAGGWSSFSTAYMGGGGGGGGVVYVTQCTLTPQTYTIVVGAGATTMGAIPDSTGSDTYILNQTGQLVFRALGGGRGGGINTIPATAGGCGGGSYYLDAPTNPIAGLQTTYTQPVGSPGIITSRGWPGGVWVSGTSGGGGGAGFKGTDGIAYGGIVWAWPGQPGGIGTNPTPITQTEFRGPVIGVPSLDPALGYYGGGGGSGAGSHPYRGSGTPGGGGLGGGGAGAANASTTGTPGGQNLGGGGGGGANSNSSGGSGIVVIRYRI